MKASAESRVALAIVSHCYGSALPKNCARCVQARATTLSVCRFDAIQHVDMSKPQPETAVTEFGDHAAVKALCAEHGGSEIRIQGSAIKLGALAEGSLQTMSGGPLLYGKPGFKNPDFIARGRIGP